MRGGLPLDVHDLRVWPAYDPTALHLARYCARNPVVLERRQRRTPRRCRLLIAALDDRATGYASIVPGRGA